MATILLAEIAWNENASVTVFAKIFVRPEVTASLKLDLVCCDTNDSTDVSLTQFVASHAVEPVWAF